MKQWQIPISVYLGGGKNCIREYARNVLGITEKYVVIAIGQFIYRKGFDILMKAASQLPPDFGVYIIGGEPTDEYLQLKQSLNLGNIHFVGFKKKSELSYYYQAADCTAFPTREDIWGLITNESMAFGVPVVASDKCISALEMIEDGKNGYIIPANDVSALAFGITNLIIKDTRDMCVNTAKFYTIEKMALSHAAVWGLNH